MAIKSSQSAESSAELRLLPQVDRLSNALDDQTPAPLRVEAARKAIEQAAETIRAGGPRPDFETFVSQAETFLHAARRRRLVRVVNATGVLLHTNLGRAPLAQSAIQAMTSFAAGYSNLEYDLSKQKRGNRYQHAADLLTAATGAEAALVVNNNAAAVLLAISAAAGGVRGEENGGVRRGSGEVIVSRGELIEIGGEFRIPEIVSASGAVMKEVGTTNRTHLRDYAGAVSESTAAILKVHPSNYKVVGFTAQVSASDLADLCRERGLPLIHDLGSGLLSRRIAGVEPAWLFQEPSVAQALQDGADAVTFSGDKLLGGPQAGILLGTSEFIAQCSRSPLLRAFRVDKTTLAALEATMLLYLDGKEREIPFWRMALAEPSAIEARAVALVSSLATIKATFNLVPGASTPGGGSAPGVGIPTVLIEIKAEEVSAKNTLTSLSAGDPPVIGRIENGNVVLDLRTVEESEDSMVAAALARVFA